jgi:hypothetical protein
LTLLNVYCIDAAEITFSKTEIMNGIKQVGFAGSVFTTNPNYSVVKIEGLPLIVFELEK